jgi:transcription antitermination factor NusG
MDPRWCAVYLVARHEKAVAQQLWRRSVESFLPLYRTVHCWNGRRAQLELPLFPSYIFVRITARERLRVLEVPGVVNIVSFNGAPATVSDEEVVALRTALEQRPCQPWPYLAVGRRVRIKTGPLTGLEGVVARQQSTSRIIVSIDFIQRSVCVELAPCDLEQLP